MTVTVSVDATWRMSRVEFNTAHNVPWEVRGNGEVLLQETADASPDAAVLGKAVAREEGSKKTYGTMPAALVSRFVDDVLDETVEINGQTIGFDLIMAALPMFFERWRAEDAEKPPGPAAMSATPMMPSPQAAELTPMPTGPTGPPHEIPLPPQ